jgi:hypothetical protein
MGIDVYVRRDLPRAAASIEEPVAGAAREAAPSGDAPGGSPIAPGLRAPAPEAGVADARALLEEPTSSAAAPSARGVPEGPTAEPGMPAREASAAGEAPRFRLTALRAGAGLLLVDEALLPHERRDVLLRLGDLLRAGLLLRDAQGAPARDMETQAFFWPQVEAEHIDQSMPQAVAALGGWVRRCTEDGEGCLVVITPAPDSPAATPLAALETLPLRRARIDAAFVTAPDAEAHRAAWRALAALAPDPAAS